MEGPWTQGDPRAALTEAPASERAFVERGLEVLGFVGDVAAEQALMIEYSCLPWDLREAWGVVRGSPGFALVGAEEVVPQHYPIPSQAPYALDRMSEDLGALVLEDAAVVETSAEVLGEVLAESRDALHREDNLATQSTGAGPSRLAVPARVVNEGVVFGVGLPLSSPSSSMRELLSRAPSLIMDMERNAWDEEEENGEEVELEEYEFDMDLQAAMAASLRGKYFYPSSLVGTYPPFQALRSMSVGDMELEGEHERKRRRVEKGKDKV